MADNVLRASRIAAFPRPPVAELGLQVDLSASASSLFVLTGFAALQLKVRAAIEKREARDAARETLRKAEVLLLAGKLEADAVERAREAANWRWRRTRTSARSPRSAASRCGS